MNAKVILGLLALLLISCNILVPVSPTPELTRTLPVESSPTAVNQPGLVVRGHVTVNGVALSGVKIYKRFSAYPAEFIATTDQNGYYESDFIDIPGDEMVSIEAELAGYTFDPPYCYWRHYHGYELTTCDFTAIAAP
jgi:hypothetical protein